MLCCAHVQVVGFNGLTVPRRGLVPRHSNLYGLRGVGSSRMGLRPNKLCSCNSKYPSPSAKCLHCRSWFVPIPRRDLKTHNPTTIHPSKSTAPPIAVLLHFFSASFKPTTLPPKFLPTPLTTPPSPCYNKKRQLRNISFHTNIGIQEEKSCPPNANSHAKK